MVLGSELTMMALADLAQRWIDRLWAEAAGLRCVDDEQGRQMVGAAKKPGDYSGIAIPYILPGGADPVAYRLRRRNPDLEAKSRKPKQKYMAAPGDRNHVYFPPHVTPEQLQDPTLPLVITEGELKTLALRRLAAHESRSMRFLAIGLSGVWNFRGTIGNESNSNGVRVQVKGTLPELDLINWVNRDVIIAYDSDLVRKDDVRKARHALSVELRQRGANVGFLEWDQEQGKGIDDWLANVGPDIVLAEIARVEYNTATGWRAKLLCTDTGKPKGLLENARLAVEGIPEFAGIALDEFSGRIIRPASVPWPSDSKEWGDLDNIELAAYLQRAHIEVSKDTAADAAYLVAARNRFHPVRDYLKSLTWDGEPRVDTWLVRYAGVAPSNYVSAIGRYWLVSAVARIMRPGEKVDSAILLIGKEGSGKSTICRTLGEPWFSDDMPNDLGQKDAQLHLNGHWVIELGEMAQMDKTEIQTLKTWMSRSEDIYRPPYGRMLVHKPRQCIFIATSNNPEPLKDTPGNRRFWPVDVGKIDLDALRRDKDQLWAEAYQLFAEGAEWHFTDPEMIEEARQEQAERMDMHVWFEPIQKWCQDYPEVTVTQALSKCIGKEQKNQTHADKLNVVRCLQAMGWKLVQKRVAGVVTKVYKNPESLDLS